MCNISAPPKNPEIMAGRIVRLASDPILRETYGKSVRLAIKEKNNYY